jgi:CRISPR/Cas system CMR-associated protein Cmr5 small subunit
MQRDQVRARHVFSFVRGPLQSSAEFLALARKLPIMLQTNGLLATWAHLLAKGKPEHKAALKALADHLRDLDPSMGTDSPDPANLFNTWIDAQRGLTGAALRAKTAEAVQIAVWLKRAAEALCDSAAQAGAPEVEA